MANLHHPNHQGTIYFCVLHKVLKVKLKISAEYIFMTNIKYNMCVVHTVTRNTSYSVFHN